MTRILGGAANAFGGTRQSPCASPPPIRYANEPPQPLRSVWSKAAGRKLYRQGVRPMSRIIVALALLALPGAAFAQSTARPAAPAATSSRQQQAGAGQPPTRVGDIPLAAGQAWRKAGWRPDTCSPVGAGGATGCTAQMLRQWTAEQRAKRRGEPVDDSGQP